MHFEKIWKTLVSASLAVLSSTSFLLFSFFMKQCTDIFGENFNATVVKHGISWTNANYGGYGLTSTRVKLQVTIIDIALEEGMLHFSKSNLGV